MLAPVFLLAPGRSFTSVVNTVIGQHPEMFGLPEINLTLGTTVGEWLDRTEPFRPFMQAGMLRAIAHLETGVQSNQTTLMARQWLFQNRDMPMSELFAMIRNSVAPRAVVEKSPSSLASVSALGRLLGMAPDARFIHVTRHPFTNCHSMAKTDWFRATLQFAGSEAQDPSTNPPVFDPQFHWLRAHQRVVEFSAQVAKANWLQVRGEDILERPDATLAEICRWLRIDDGPEAIAQMKRPEASPFAGWGPGAAPTGNDPSFLNSPELRALAAPDAPLQGTVPWRHDGAGLVPEVVELAERFGYARDAA